VEHQDLLDAIEDLAPEAQFVLLVFTANHLREAVDQGRLGLAVFNQAVAHLKMLADRGPGAMQ
jgi:hypothetical protein